MRDEDNYERNKRRKEKESKKSNKIQIAAIIVAAVVAIITTFMTIFSSEIRKGVYALFNNAEETVQASPVNETLPYEDEITTNDDSDYNEITENLTTDQDSYSEQITEKTTTRSSTKQETTYTTKQTTQEPKVIKPKVSLGTEVNSIEFLQIESDNTFVTNRTSASVETFYNGFEKEYREKGLKDNTYIVFNANGYGMCCTVPLKKNGDLYYAGELCDYSKISVGQDESHNKYKLHCFMGVDENDQMILGFSFEKPLAQGTYYCLFKIYDSDSDRTDNIYIKFRVK